MSDMVTIKCIEGSLKGQTWTFHCVDTAIIGRTAKEDRTIVNKINVTGNDRISRFNTFFKIDPPYVIVRDMGSLNGTYVNGRIIGKERTACQRRREEEAPTVRSGLRTVT